MSEEEFCLINKYCFTLLLKIEVLKGLKLGVSSCRRSTAVADIACLPVFVPKHVIYRLSFEVYLVFCQWMFLA